MIYRIVVDNVDRYSIELRWSAGGYTLHPIIYPPNRRGGGVLSHHLYDDGSICVSSGYQPWTLDTAKALAQLWARGWSQYQRTGAFPNGAARVYVGG